MLNKDKKERV